MSPRKSGNAGTSIKKATKGKVRNATPTTYDKINFKSKLEVFCYKLLLKNNIEANYEKHKFIILDSFKYNDEAVRQMTFKPDFVVLDEFVIECKGWANESFPLRWKFFKHFLYQNSIQLDLYLPRNQKQVIEAVETILRKREEKRKREELLQS